MLTEQLRGLVAEGTSILVGFVEADGRPYATRAYGFTVHDDGRRARMLLRPTDLAPLGIAVGDRPGVPVAVTGAVVRTLDSVQVKGRLVAVEEATAEDLVHGHHHVEAFIDAVVAVDRFPRRHMERWRPGDVVACVVVIDELFSQTPGPGAGAALGPVVEGPQ